MSLNLQCAVHVDMLTDWTDANLLSCITDLLVCEDKSSRWRGYEFWSVGRDGKELMRTYFNWECKILTGD